MPGQYVGVSDDAGDKLLVNSDGTIGVVQVDDPALIGRYFYSNNDMAGVVAANNFISLFNPAASGRIMKVHTILVGAYTTTTTAVAASMIVRRTTAASAGAVDSTVIKSDSTYPASTSVVRITNPTVTTAGQIFAHTPPLGAGSFNGGSGIQLVHAGDPNDLIVLREGEGIVFSTASGTTDQRWNVSVGWFEL